MKRPDLLPVTFDKAVSKVVEEAGEILQEVGKMQQYGYYATDPKTGKTYDNVAAFFAECSDMEHAIGRARKLWEERKV